MLAELLELAPGGVEEVDLGDDVEYAVYGAPGELPALPDLRAAAGDALVEVTTTEVADDWAERWRDVPPPADDRRAAARAPAVGAAPGEPGLLDIVIDPGQAFGTGAHHTTRLCLELLLELEPGAAPFADLGCGSGVLAIAAAKLGWAPVAGVDHERASVAATRRQRRGQRRRGRAPRASTCCATAPRRPRRRSSRTCCARCCCGSPRAGFDGAAAARRSSPAACCAHEADEIAARVRAATACASATRRHGGEWAALPLARRAEYAGAVASGMAWNVVIAGAASAASTPRGRSSGCSRRTAAHVTLVNDVNFMLYTPLLPGAAAGTLEPRHVVVPLREELDPAIDLRLAPDHRRDAGAQPAPDPLARRPRGGPALRPARRRARLGQPHAADPRPRRARDRLQVAARGDRAAQPRHPHARDRRDARGRRRPPRAADLRLRRRRLRGPRGPRRAAGLRRRRHRPLPALPRHRDALDPRRGDRARHARDRPEARRVRRARAARPRDRDPHEHDARRGHGLERDAERRRGRPDAHRRLDRRRQAAPGRRAARPAARRPRPDRRRQPPAGPGLRQRLGDRRLRRRARPGAQGRSPARRPPSTRSARAASSGATSPRRSAAAGTSAFSYKTKGVFVDMGRRKAVATTGRSRGAARRPGCSPAPTTSR